jgi:hypothetical protein
MTAQCDIEQQIRRSRLVEYVADFGSMSEADAASWLDANCPAWRLGVEPAANKIEVASDDSDDN